MWAIDAERRKTLQRVEELQRPWRQHHPNLAWRHLHRVDEDLLLVVPREEALATAETLYADFDRSIKDERLRQRWVGGDGKPGKLSQAIEDLKSADVDRQREGRHLLRGADHVLNAQTDRAFWSLSVSTLTIVISGLALCVGMSAYWWLRYPILLDKLGLAPSAIDPRPISRGRSRRRSARSRPIPTAWLPPLVKGYLRLRRIKHGAG